MGKTSQLKLLLGEVEVPRRHLGQREERISHTRRISKMARIAPRARTHIRAQHAATASLCGLYLHEFCMP